MTPFRRHQGDPDEGAVIILVALLMVGMMTIAAIVLDLGQQRVARHDSQSAADLAALAAGPRLGDGLPRAACETAWLSLRSNLATLPATATSPCASVPATATCTTPTDHLSTSPPYVITVRYPVSNADISDSRRSGGTGSNDGDACHRMRVTVTRTSDTFFGGVVGVDQLRASGSAVVRAASSSQARIPALWLLDPVGCVALDVTGGSVVTVGSSSPLVEGYIVSDSDGSACSSNQQTVQVDGSTTLRAVPASGAIGLYAMPAGATLCTGSACRPSDVAGGNLSPQPQRSLRRATRAPVDHRFDCKVSYPLYRSVVPIAACGQVATTPAHITNLRSAIGASGAPGGYTTYSSCNGNVPPPSGNVFVNCADFKLTGGASVTFSGNVVFRGQVTVQNSTLVFQRSSPASLSPPCLSTVVGCTTASSANASFVYVRGGQFKAQQSTVTLDHTLLYMPDGTISMGGSGSNVSWSAPAEGPFKGLALWSESSQDAGFSAGVNMTLLGTFFTPNALFTLSGGAVQDLRHAQFVSYRLKINGGAVLTLSPNLDTAVPAPPPGIALIR